jgi:hypothetical protein
VSGLGAGAGATLDGATLGDATPGGAGMGAAGRTRAWTAGASAGGRARGCCRTGAVLWAAVLGTAVPRTAGGRLAAQVTKPQLWASGRACGPRDRVSNAIATPASRAATAAAPTTGYHCGLEKGLGRRQDAFPAGAPSLAPGGSGVDTLPLTPVRMNSSSWAVTPDQQRTRAKGETPGKEGKSRASLSGGMRAEFQS